MSLTLAAEVVALTAIVAGFVLLALKMMLKGSTPKDRVGLVQALAGLIHALATWLPWTRSVVWSTTDTDKQNDHQDDHQGDTAAVTDEARADIPRQRRPRNRKRQPTRPQD